ncbi:MAG: hypothetical protein GDA56_11490 [Hormoscilla sp. GM7CHS1pb]|nr:hypothetical protein [Hormoscilla sp. GM7CHS1pb]
MKRLNWYFHGVIAIFRTLRAPSAASGGLQQQQLRSTQQEDPPKQSPLGRRLLWLRHAARSGGVTLTIATISQLQSPLNISGVVRVALPRNIEAMTYWRCTFLDDSSQWLPFPGGSQGTRKIEKRTEVCSEDGTSSLRTSEKSDINLWLFMTISIDH